MVHTEPFATPSSLFFAWQFIMCFSFNTKEDELGEACSAHGGDKKLVRNFDWQA
jgi:hypothetical protein